uniref:CSON008796 protein n=1 Tax=Culicoides sonorensis TaxID=179676 RepID=A0A336N2C7_CULSO
MERKQVARKSYVDPHKRQKVVHASSTNGQDDLPIHSEEKEEDGETQVISSDEGEPNLDSSTDGPVTGENEENTRNESPSLDVDPDKETPTSTNDENVASPDKNDLENGEIIKDDSVQTSTVNGDDETIPDSTTETKNANELKTKSSEDPPSQVEDVTID